MYEYSVTWYCVIFLAENGREQNDLRCFCRCLHIQVTSTEAYTVNLIVHCLVDSRSRQSRQLRKMLPKVNECHVVDMHTGWTKTKVCTLQRVQILIMTMQRVLASCLIYARALLEYAIFILWVRSVRKMLPSVKFAEDQVLSFFILREKC